MADDSRPIILGPEAGRTLQNGTRHTWQNVGSGPARILVVFNPAGSMQDFFERFAALDDDEDFAVAFSRLGDEAGMEVVGPPLAVSDPP